MLVTSKKTHILEVKINYIICIHVVATIEYDYRYFYVQNSKPPRKTRKYVSFLAETRNFLKWSQIF